MFFAAGFIGMLVFGWFLFPSLMYQKLEQPFQFSHVTHTDLTGMSCSDCHYVKSDGQFSGIPRNENCSMCHMGVLGETEDERIFVEEYLMKDREVPWFVYSRQPENVYFPHVQHINFGEISCERCHGEHGTSESLRPFQQNRLSGYSRDIWGPSITRINNPPGIGMKMNDCIRCHERSDLTIGCIGCHK
jgi:menaquinone reductase, multiheme cytochrome c subunit